MTEREAGRGIGGPSGPRRSPWRRRIRIAAAAIAGLVVLSVPFWGPVVMRRMEFFRLRRLEIEGTRYIPSSEIVALARLDTTESVWDPTAPVASRIASHPGVRSVEISRKLPGTLVITVTEFQPIALVPGPQGLRAFDERGVALPIDPTRVDVDVPVMATADTGLLSFLGRVRSGLPPLYGRISEVKREGAHEVLLQLPDLRIRAMTSVSLNDLYQIQGVEADLRRRGARATELDLRYRDQIVARLQ
jgi:cell division protein FtsQ